MAAIGDHLLVLWNAICSVFKLLFWCLEGVENLASMLTTGITVFVDVVGFFPLQWYLLLLPAAVYS